MQGRKDGLEFMSDFSQACKLNDASDIFNFLVIKHNDLLQIGVEMSNWLFSNRHLATTEMLNIAFKRAICALFAAEHLQELMQEIKEGLDPSQNQQELSNRGVLTKYIRQSVDATSTLSETVDNLYPLAYPSGEVDARENHQRYSNRYLSEFIEILSIPVSNLN